MYTKYTVLSSLASAQNLHEGPGLLLDFSCLFNTKSHTNVISEGSFQSLMFRDFVFTGASRWFELIEDWLRLGEDVYMIFYEDMVQDPVRELRKLMEYLGLTVDEGCLSCISDHLAGTFHRPVHQLTDPFSADHHIIIDNLIEKAGKIVKEKTGKNLPTDKYDFMKKHNLRNKFSRSNQKNH